MFFAAGIAVHVPGIAPHPPPIAFLASGIAFPALSCYRISALRGMTYTRRTKGVQSSSFPARSSRSPVQCSRLPEQSASGGLRSLRSGSQSSRSGGQSTSPGNDLVRSPRESPRFGSRALRQGKRSWRSGERSLRPFVRCSAAVASSRFHARCLARQLRVVRRARQGFQSTGSIVSRPSLTSTFTPLPTSKPASLSQCPRSRR